MARTRTDHPAYLVTTAGESPQQDRRDRERRYLILMGVRVVAIILAIVIGRLFDLGPLLLVLVAAAMVLPWIAVVTANAPKQLQSRTPSLWSPNRRRLGSGEQPPHEDAA
jgi:hypothetical protein